MQNFSPCLFIIRDRQFFRFATIVLELIQGHAQHVNDLMKTRALLPGILHHHHLASKM